MEYVKIDENNLECREVVSKNLIIEQRNTILAQIAKEKADLESKNKAIDDKWKPVLEEFNKIFQTQGWPLDP